MALLKKRTKTSKASSSQPQDLEGNLVVDVYKTKNAIVVESTIAGAKPQDIDLFFDQDTLTVRGTRHRDQEIHESDFYYRECYFGNFSRSIVIPEAVDAQNISASLENGILTVTLPLLKSEK